MHMGTRQRIYGRGASKGLVSVQVALSIPVILMLIALAVYVGRFYRANIELLELAQEAARVCSRNLPPAEARQCVLNRLNTGAPRVNGCDEAQSFSNVGTTTVVYAEEDLAEDRALSLNWLEARVDCVGAFGLPFAGIDQFNLTAEAAMPMRLGDLVE